MAKWKLQAAGLPIPEGPFSLNPANLVGRPVMIVVRHEDYEGKPQVRVKGWDAAPGGSSPASKTDDSIPF